LTPFRKAATPEDVQENDETTAQETSGFQFINQTGSKIKDPKIKKLVRQNAINRKYDWHIDFFLLPQRISKERQILKMT
jgi:Uri superfamily endonuclease